MSVRVRYAPSPTGFLHIGNARTALFNFLFARKHGGKFIIRIEDTDVERNVEGGEKSQLEYLKWLGITWDESVDVGGDYGPYRQLERLDIYKKYADELLEKGLAYKCYCTEDELAKEREELMATGADRLHYSGRCRNLSESERAELESRGEYTIRYAVPKGETYIFNDIVKGEVSFSSDDIGDWVIVKKNGIPTYNFAVVIDDYLMKISHVLRGEDHITNTPKQIGIYQAFGWEVPTFGHMTLIVNENNKKLSKRDQTIIQFIGQYADLGYLPEALFNFIGLLGWSPEGEEEILSMSQFIENFDEKRLSKSPAKFDKNKLAFINNRYIKDLQIDEVVSLCKPHLENEETFADKDSIWIEKLVGLFHNRMSYGAEIVDLYKEFFSNEFVIEDDAKAFITENDCSTTIKVLKNKLGSLEDFTAENIKILIKEVGKEANVKGKMLFMPARIATTGQMHGPDLPQALELIGKDKIINRLENF